MNDAELLRRFADHHDEDAFAELVRSKINLVYAAALRQVGGDTHLAQDVTQGVFIALACHAPRLARHPVLSGWLYTTTRNLAAKAVRGQRRWQRREAEAITMNLEANDNEGPWRDLRPALDEAMHELAASDRTALLLRFFEGRSQAEVGTALGLTENAARMRLDRALEKLRQRLARRGITSTAAALATGLASEALVAAPAGLSSSVTAGALSCATASAAALAGGAVAAALSFMNTTKLILGAVGAVALFGVGTLVGGSLFRPSEPVVRPTVEQLRTDNAALWREAEQWRARAASAEAARSGRHESPAVTAPTDDIHATRDKWKLVTELHRSRLLKGSLAFIDGAGRLHAGVASLFDLTPNEQKTLQHFVDRARERMEALELSRATITQTSPDTFAIALEPFPREGGVVYDELMQGLANTLGPERNGAFVTLAGEDLERAFGLFGAAKRTVTVTRRSGENSDYFAWDKVTTEGSNWNNSSNYKSRDDLLARLGTITKLLPPDF